MKVLAASALLVLALAGCAAESPSALAPTPAPSSARPTATPTPTPTRSPIPSSTPTAAVHVKPELEDIVISHDGLGPVAIGTDLATLDPAISIFVNEPDDCGTGVFLDKWRANYPDRPLGNELRTFEAGWVDGPLENVQVFGPGPHTAKGIQVGSTLDQLLSAHPSAVHVNSGARRDRYAVYGSPANLYFDITTEEGDVGPAGSIVSLGVTSLDPASWAPSFHPPGSC